MRLSVLLILVIGHQILEISGSETLGVGIGFGRSSTPYADALNQLRSKGVFVLKTWNINEAWLDAVESVYSDVDVDITVAIPNGDLWKMNGDEGHVNWVLGQLQKHRRIIKLVAIGNEPYHEMNRPTAMPHLVNAFNRMVKLLADNGLQNEIKVTIPFSSVILANTYPVENTVFEGGIIDAIRTIVPTLQSTGSKFSINLYPFFAYSYASDIPLDFALGKDGSLFEAMLRGCRVALDKIGANSLPIIVGETGWPSAGGKDTNVENERAFTEHVTDFVRHNNLAETIYIFEAFDESEKPGADTERHFGIMDENRNPKFDFDIASYRPCTQWGWRFYDHVDIVGADLGIEIPAGNRNDCQPLCAEIPECQSYTWFNNVCYMKSGGKSFKPANEVYSAISC